MLYLKIQTYEALSSVQWAISVRDLDAQDGDDPLVLYARGATPMRTDLDSLDAVVLVAQQAIQRAVQSHMLGPARHESDEDVT